MEADVKNENIAIDPVCLMTVEKDKAHGTSQYKGETYYFCSLMCKAKFEKEFDKDRLIGKMYAAGK